MMKKISNVRLLPFLAVLLGSPSHADWTKVSANDNSNCALYVNLVNIKMDDGSLYFWQLYDCLEPDQSGNLSFKTLSEINCSFPKRYRDHYSFHYSTLMARGEPNLTYNRTTEWINSALGSPIENLLDLICK
jgi:hypothetical protein